MLFSGSDYAVPPAMDELEVTIIGPGYGEAICVHVGDGRWILIDSCKAPKSTTACSVQYLSDIGVDLKNVFAIVASHWDDDHIRGLAETVASCPNARFVASLAFKGDEFHAYAAAFDSPLTSRARSGVKEIRATFKALAVANRKPLGASPNRQVFGPADLSLTHGKPFEMWTLSPSDEEYTNFLAWVAEQMPDIQETRRVSVAKKRNDLSTVVLLKVGNATILLGGDLEEHGQPGIGWTAILTGPGRPTAKASLYKVAHHGALSGDHPQIWADLLHSEPVAIVAPWKLGGRSLPSVSDVGRILGHTSDAHATISLSGRAPKKRDATVEKQIRQTARSFVAAPQSPGMLRLRRNVSGSSWQTEYFGGAVHLSRVHA